MSRLIRVLLVGASLTLLGPTVASAAPVPGGPVGPVKPGFRSFAATYPIASRLCAEAQRGHAPKPLRDSTPQVLQACGTLRGSFTQAQAAVRASDRQLMAQLQADRRQLRQACQQARRSHNGAACRQARQVLHARVQAIQAQRRAANKQYVAAAEAARKAFWATIRALRGGSSVTPDSPVQA